ncbi:MULTISPECIES: SAM-dependent methyltransferase [Myxococcus]|uniref:class I SAM-dependent methyltransferase n=1 Tax=Myxococcus sp. CA005 TaxID=2562800 RepID=UPI0003674528|nr:MULTISPECIES: SAM-dependent methyltransferase [Myxococcus]NOJ57880.1 SAM-dependent methyltransferase [Myxococcus xanthus]QPM78424.1 SAM-dependent methyltransferase [Myxococcus xanthus]QVW67492.1 SAM-dependent methyltransferase [Myxococcus xanthus DZ2]UEO06381.1 SAM-dependent methyltransferase [Myxococcus xanthus DZ2]UYI13329.1 SAM-dependent methyltransferase [Myxococcus xanthus]
MPVVHGDAEDGNRGAPAGNDSRGPRGGVRLRRNVKASQVRRELLPDQSPALLRELHLLTREGHLNADALRKLKQVNHLMGLLRPAVEDVQARHPNAVMVDAGSGNAYLGFVLYELFLKGSASGTLLSIEGRPDLTERAQGRAQRLGFTRMQFQTAHIDTAQYPERIHLLMALHACDTATDDALVAAIRHGADHVAVVPCCQAEVAAQLKEKRPVVASSGSMSLLYAHAWHRREFGSHLTNVIRALTLEAFGYQVTVTELTGWEHSLKNELILGRRVHRENRRARMQLERLLAETGVNPKLTRELGVKPAVSAAVETVSAPEPDVSEEASEHVVAR